MVQYRSLQNPLITIAAAWALFSAGAWAILRVLPRTFLSNQVPAFNLSYELGGLLTLYITPLATVLGFVYMYFFGGMLSTRAMELYLFVMRGKHTLGLNDPAKAPRKGSFTMKIQGEYFLFILAVVVSFATYLSKNRDLPIVATFTRTRDVANLISQDFIVLTMTASLMLPIVALALPYYSGMFRLRSIDTGKFHTTVISTTIGASGGFSFLYALVQKPELFSVLFYTLILMGVSWCFAFGCSLAAGRAGRVIEQFISRPAKPGSRLVTSTILLRDVTGKIEEA